MDVLRHQFSNELVKILQLIADSHFVAVDLEFSGISSRRTRGGKSRLSLQQVYEEVREAAKQYQVLQVGLTIVEENSHKGVYILRPYNFYINPIPAKEEYHHIERIWSCQSGAVSFLLKNNFRFDLPFSEGIAYLSREEEEQIRASWAVRDSERAALEDMILKVDDKPLVGHIHFSVQEWLSQPLLEREDYLNIPNLTEERPRIKHIPSTLNRYQIRLTHQIIRKDYPNLKSLGKDGFVRITIRSEKEDAEQKLRQERYREQDVAQAIDFRWLIEALCGGDISKIPERYFLTAISGDVKPDNGGVIYRQYVDKLQHKLSTRRRVLVGHNCFTDLIYLYVCFIGEPPERVEDFQELIHGLFPAVVDTKYLASFVGNLRFNSELGALEKAMEAEKVPAIEVPVAFDRYVWGEHFHEAGFDSFMTARIAIKLSAKLQREGKLCEPKKPQKIVKSGETILMDATVNTEDEEQTDEYVTAPESAAETDSVMSELASKLSAVFSAPQKAIHNISRPFAGRKLPAIDSLVQPDLLNGEDVKSVPGKQDDTEREPAGQRSDDSILRSKDTASDAPAIGSHVMAVKEEIVDWPRPAEVKQIKHALAHNHSFDIIDTPIGPVTDRPPSNEHQSVNESIPKGSEAKKDAAADLLIWSDKEDDDDDPVGESGRVASKGAPVHVEGLEKPTTAPGLQDRSHIAANGEMMPTWESESGIWAVIGNRLVVNACEEGVCIL